MSSGLEIKTSFTPLQWVFYFVQPKVAVNGHEYPLTWGTRVAQFPPGQYHVKIWVPYLFGPACVAETQVAVYDGQVTSVSYETAMFVFSAGSLMVHGARPFGT